jgi:hypothetical protein
MDYKLTYRLRAQFNRWYIFYLAQLHIYEISLIDPNN